MNEPALTGPVHIIGAGLIGTSIGLALRRADIEVWLSDHNHEHVRTASSLGAGVARPSEGSPQLVVVAVPPDHIGSVVVAALEEDPAAIVTDIGSVKCLPLTEVSDHVAPADLARYVGGHPMAGSERSGPLAASAELFGGRPWAITPDVHADAAAVAVVEALVACCGALPVRLSPVEHDHAVARTSHVPHLLAVLTAAQLGEAVPEHLTLSGQGVRDVTRVAAGDPDLYGQIIRANGAAVVELLETVRSDLGELIEAIRAPDGEPLAGVLQRGVEGTRVIPAKHGGPPLDTTEVQVQVTDTPGELARLLREVGDIGVNLEDLHIDHDPGRPTGLVELTVTAGHAEELREALAARGWVTHR